MIRTGTPSPASEAGLVPAPQIDPFQQDSAPASGTDAALNAAPRWLAVAQDADPARRGFLFRRLLLASDLVALAASFGALVCVNAIAGRQALDPIDLAIFLVLTPGWIGMAVLLGLYHLSERRIDHTMVDEVGPIVMVTTLWAWVFVLVAAIVHSGPVELLGPIVLWSFAIVAITGFRVFGRRLAQDATWFRQPVLLIGDASDVDRVLRRVLRHPECGLEPIGAIRAWRGEFSLDRFSEGSFDTSSQTAGIPRPTPEQIADIVRLSGVGRVIVTGWSEYLGERTELIRVLADCDVCVDFVSGEPEALCSTGVLHHLEGLPMLTVRPTTMTKGVAARKARHRCRCRRAWPARPVPALRLRRDPDQARLAGPGPLPPRPIGAGRGRVRADQVPDDGRGRRPPARRAARAQPARLRSTPAQAARRPTGHALRRLDAALVARRAATALERL